MYFTWMTQNDWSLPLRVNCHCLLLWTCVHHLSSASHCVRLANSLTLRSGFSPPPLLLLLMWYLLPYSTRVKPLFVRQEGVVFRRNRTSISKGLHQVSVFVVEHTEWEGWSKFHCDNLEIPIYLQVLKVWGKYCVWIYRVCTSRPIILV